MILHDVGECLRNVSRSPTFFFLGPETSKKCRENFSRIVLQTTRTMFSYDRFYVVANFATMDTASR